MLQGNLSLRLIRCDDGTPVVEELAAEKWTVVPDSNGGLFLDVEGCIGECRGIFVFRFNRRKGAEEIHVYDCVSGVFTVDSLTERRMDGIAN